jgi:hypothetical protein
MSERTTEPLTKTTSMPIEAAVEEKVHLAAYEGHDADIPSNAGVLSEKELVEVQDANGAAKLSSGDSSKDVKDVEANAAEMEPVDKNVVWWDGPDDPQNPMNWSGARKAGIVAIVSAVTFVT